MEKTSQQLLYLGKIDSVMPSFMETKHFYLWLWKDHGGLWNLCLHCWSVMCYTNALWIWKKTKCCSSTLHVHIENKLYVEIKLTFLGSPLTFDKFQAPEFLQTWMRPARPLLGPLKICLYRRLALCSHPSQKFVDRTYHALFMLLQTSNANS